MRAARLLPLALGVIALGGVAAACHGGAPAPMPPGGTLRPCPPTPNCVSTEAADRRHAMEPLPFAATPEEARARARAALLAEPRVTLVEERPGYLRAEARSRLFRFVDDVEVLVDSAARVVRFRSASRVGRGDLGVNRARMERFGARFRGAGETAQP